MSKNEREDEPTKDFKQAVKATDKPSKKEKKRIDKITKRLPKNEKLQALKGHEKFLQLSVDSSQRRTSS